MFEKVGVIVNVWVEDAANSTPTDVKVIQPEVRVAPSTVMSPITAISPVSAQGVLFW